MTDEIQIPKTRFIATNDVEKLTSRRPYVAERFYLQMKNGPGLVLVRDVDYEATEKERDHWKARAERAEAELAALQLKNAKRENRERDALEAADVGIPWAHGDTFVCVLQELKATREYVVGRWRPATNKLPIGTLCRLLFNSGVFLSDGFNVPGIDGEPVAVVPDAYSIIKGE